MAGEEHLSGPDCLRLLASRSFGRLAYTDRALPSILPLRYGLVGRQVVLRPGTDGLAQRLDGQVVAFEVDAVDTDPAEVHGEPDGGHGWIVVVTGFARLARDPLELLPHDPGGPPAAPPVPPHVVGIALGVVRGHVRRHAAAPAHR